MVKRNPSALLLGDGRGEIGGFVGDPIDKFAHGGIGQQLLHVHRVALQFGIGEIGNQSLLANGVHGHHIAPTAALGNGMVPNNCLACRPAAQPAGCYRRWSFLLAMQVWIGTMF